MMQLGGKLDGKLEHELLKEGGEENPANPGNSQSDDITLGPCMTYEHIHRTPRHQNNKPPLEHHKPKHTKQYTDTPTMAHGSDLPNPHKNHVEYKAGQNWSTSYQLFQNLAGFFFFSRAESKRVMILS